MSSFATNLGRPWAASQVVLSSDALLSFTAPSCGCFSFCLHLGFSWLVWWQSYGSSCFKRIWLSQGTCTIEQLFALSLVCVFCLLLVNMPARQLLALTPLGGLRGQRFHLWMKLASAVFRCFFVVLFRTVVSLVVYVRD